MNQEKPRGNGFIIYFVIIAALLLFTAWIGSRGSSEPVYSRGDLIKDIEAGNVIRITINCKTKKPIAW